MHRVQMYIEHTHTKHAQHKNKWSKNAHEVLRQGQAISACDVEAPGKTNEKNRIEIVHPKIPNDMLLILVLYDVHRPPVSAFVVRPVFTVLILAPKQLHLIEKCPPIQIHGRAPCSRTESYRQRYLALT